MAFYRSGSTGRDWKGWVEWEPSMGEYYMHYPTAAGFPPNLDKSYSQPCRNTRRLPQEKIAEGYWVLYDADMQVAEGL